MLASTGTVHLPPKVDGSVRLWDVRSGRGLASFQTTGVNSLAFTPSGGVVVAASVGTPRQLTFWDAKTLMETRQLAGFFTVVAFSTEGDRMATTRPGHGLHVLETATGRPVADLQGHQDAVTSVAFDPKGGRLASGSSDETIILWDSKGGAKLSVRSEADRFVRFWDVDAGAEIRALKAPAGSVNCVAFHPQWTVLALGTSDGFVRFFGPPRD